MDFTREQITILFSYMVDIANNAVNTVNLYWPDESPDTDVSPQIVKLAFSLEALQNKFKEFGLHEYLHNPVVKEK